MLSLNSLDYGLVLVIVLFFLTYYYYKDAAVAASAPLLSKPTVIADFAGRS